MINVRFAPSPTGELHLGGARTALFNWLYANHTGGKFFLRIEDTDKERSKQEYVDQICESMKWLGLDWDGPLVFQSQREKDYHNAVQKILKEGNAYRCFCSKDKLDEERKAADKERRIYRYGQTCQNMESAEEMDRLNRGESFTVRLKVPDGETSYTDHIYGPITVENSEIDDFIIARSDGSPTFNFVCVLDDNAMGITHVIRGEDHVPNTPKQIIIYRLFGFQEPEFAHLPMILGPDKKRLSKRHGAPGVQQFRDEGYLPDALINYLGLLGWNPDTEQEIFSREDLVELFDISQVQKKGAVFDEKKLHWVSGQHLFRLSNDEVLQHMEEVFPDWGSGADENYLLEVISSLKERVRSLSELKSLSSFYFEDPDTYEEKASRKRWKDESVNQSVAAYLSSLEGIHDWSEDKLELALRQTAEKLDLSSGKLIHPVRLALTGIGFGPSLFELMQILGKTPVSGG